MITKLNTTIKVFVSTLITSFFLSFFVEGSTFTVQYINAVFYLSLLLFIMGAIMKVISGGFFRVTQYAFKKFFLSKSQKYAEESDDTTQEDYLYTRTSYSLTRPFLLTGILLGTCSTIISFIFFV